MAIDEELFVFGVLLIAFGLSVSIGRTLLMTWVHIGSPDSHRHHVLSLYMFVTAATTPIGALIWGGVAEYVGIDPTVGGSGVVLMFGIGASIVFILAPPAVAPTTATATPAAR